ncbi:hypothetical protein CL659_03425 [bacterium]|nr:hypothetical protein [bacterium]|tara:strand:+ start:32931 stop:34295 length:1365 start_codon:yes stop_codon:yes gene_type:complete
MNFSRRSLIKFLGSLGFLGIPEMQKKYSLKTKLIEPKQIGQTMINKKFKPLDKVRVGIIGLGNRGSGHVGNLLDIDKVEIVALCDKIKAKAERSAKRITDKGYQKPAIYSNGESDFENLCKQDDIDIVYIATNWIWHAPMAICAMENGKHTALEVPMATTIKECWDMINVSEKTQRFCVMLENCCYNYWEMMILNMVRKGEFGDLTHAECAYIHDLRGLLFHDTYYEDHWRRKWYTQADGNFYPTHGLGPVAQYMNINYGDKFEYMVSMSSPEFGMSKWAKEKLPAGHPAKNEKYVRGDMNTSIIKTNKGKTIMLQHDTVSPRPYSRINMVSGTKGTFSDYPARLYLDGQEGGHSWKQGSDLDPVKKQFEHPLWKKIGEIARKSGGHGGMDFVMNYRMMTALLEGRKVDMDVYDGAAWSAPFPLSILSVKNRSAPVDFPDFTRGKWKTRGEFLI